MCCVVYADQSSRLHSPHLAWRSKSTAHTNRKPTVALSRCNTHRSSSPRDASHHRRLTTLHEPPCAGGDNAARVWHLAVGVHEHRRTHRHYVSHGWWRQARRLGGRTIAIMPTSTPTPTPTPTPTHSATTTGYPSPTSYTTPTSNATTTAIPLAVRQPGRTKASLASKL